MLRSEAAGWLARLQSRRDPEVEQKFQRWRDHDPAHAEAFERVAASYQQAGLLRYSALASSSAGAAPRPARSRTPSYVWAAAAAALIVLVSAGLYGVLGRGLWTSGTEAVMLSTKIGEIRSVRLSDGSKVTLDTATSLEVEISRMGRRALVKGGRVRFDVVRAARPFVIEAGSSIATATGAVLDVEDFGNRSRVDVLAGSAKVGEQGAPGSELSLASGETMMAVRGRGAQRRALGSAPDWTRGMLEFDGTPLEAAVDLANRYSKRKILLSTGLAQLRVTGAFRAGDIQGLSGALAEAFHLTVSRTREGNLVLSRSHANEAASR
ncbi:MAG TPA: FecR domain-containing protein [Sphingomicrobium sp.]|jgi:transmembrane sensor|nr:FecR domain-containing protein [Sphingomicrobium sp.]